MKLDSPVEGPARHITSGLSEDLLKMIERYEKENNCSILTKIDFIHTNILLLDVTVYTSLLPGASVAFTSLNLWQVGDLYYVSDMQDGKVSGFEIYLLDYKNIKTPAQFVERILHDLFYGW